MTQERRNPLPAGKYWVDVFEPDWAMFQDWVSRNTGIMKVLTTQEFDSEPKRIWYLFQVTGGKSGEFLPIWDGPGFPTIADSSINSSEDTSTLKDSIAETDKQTAETWDKLEKAAIALTVVTGIWGLYKLVKEIRS